MIADLHTAITRLLYNQGRIPSGEVDVRFDLPTKQWVESLTKPTINLYLFDMQENTDLRQTNMQAVRNGNTATIRMPPRRVDLRYLVSAFTSVVEDEHLLLWRTLATLMKHTPLPRELLPEALQTLDLPLSAKVGKVEDSSRPVDLWSALELPPRPALLYVVTVPVDLEIAFEAPLVLTRTLRYARATAEDEAAARGISSERGVVFASGQPTIGGTLRDQHGVPVAGALISVVGGAASSTTNVEGSFTLRQVALGPLTLQIAHGDNAPQQVTTRVPAESYDITLDG